MDYFELARESFRSFGSEFLYHPNERLDGKRLSAWYQANFFPERFNMSMHAKQNPAIDTAIYPSLFRELPLLLGGIGLDANAITRMWKNGVQNMTPFAKMLLALIWKQGDFGKIQLVLNGLSDKSRPRGQQSAVLFQFGRHLNDPLNEPIFDTNTFRAYQLLADQRTRAWNSEALFRAFAKASLASASATPKAKDLERYLDWWRAGIKPKLPIKTRGATIRSEAMLWVDRCLFSLGKAAALAMAR